MAPRLTKGVAATIRLGPFVDDTDGKTAETGLSIAYTDIKLSKAGGAFASKHDTTAPSHDSNGYYSVALDSTDLNTGGELEIHCKMAGALPVWKRYSVEKSVAVAAFEGATTSYLPVMANSGDETAIATVHHGATSVILRFFLREFNGNSVVGVNGLTYNTSGLTISVRRDTEASWTTFEQAVGTLENITTIGTYEAPTSGKARFKEYNAADGGYYELHLANSWFSGTGQRLLNIRVYYTGMTINPQMFRVNVDALTNTQIGYLDAAVSGVPGLTWDVTLAGGSHTTANTAGYRMYYAWLYSMASGMQAGYVTLPSVVRGTESVVLRVLIGNPGTGTTSGMMTGLTYSSSGLGFYLLDQAVDTVATFASAGGTIEGITTLGTYQAPSSGKMRFKEVSSSLAPGLYEVHLANSVFTTASREIRLVCKVSSVFYGHSIIPIVDAPATASSVAALPSASTIRAELEGVGTKLSNADAVATELHAMTEADGSVRRFTTNALEQGPGGSTTAANVNVVSLGTGTKPTPLSDDGSSGTRALKIIRLLLGYGRYA